MVEIRNTNSKFTRLRRVRNKFERLNDGHGEPAPQFQISNFQFPLSCLPLPTRLTQQETL
jgi:hypothetical protein